jgi:hypothetical protein
LLTCGYVSVCVAGVDTPSLADSTLIAILSAVFIGQDGLTQPVTQACAAGWMGLAV